MDKQYSSFKDFWPYYLSEHLNTTSRRLHYLGTSMVIIATVLCLLNAKFLWLCVVPLLGYGPAWVGHFFFEKNKPATFDYPLYSLFADFKMFYLMLTGQIANEIDQIKRAKL